MTAVMDYNPYGQSLDQLPYTQQKVLLEAQLHTRLEDLKVGDMIEGV
tara:strand:- start:328 stop:468 length:141 start_codon:yes stop_codon:yes gene_type:complete